MNPLEGEPTWTTITRGIDIFYTRPVLGSELATDRFSVAADGTGDPCHGFTFHSRLSLEEIEERLLNAVAHLRFASPLVAANLETGIHDHIFRSWVYAPAKSAVEVLEWSRKVVVVVGPTTSEDFIKTTVKNQVPYTHFDGSIILLHYYLFPNAGEPGIFSLFVHGPHTILDGIPTIAAFSSIFEWMANPEREPVDSLQWGREWQNLPPGPVTATGGPRPEWKTKGMALVNQIFSMHTNPVPTLVVQPERTEIQNRGALIRSQVVIDEERTARVLQAVKVAGYSVSHLFEAAHFLAVLSHNRVGSTVLDNAHVTNYMCIFGLQRFQLPPYNSKNSFTSAMSYAPVTLRVNEVLACEDPRERLLIALRQVKEQFDGYLANPHLPHATAAVVTLVPPHDIAVSSNPYTSVITNLGVVDRLITSNWFPDNTVPPRAALFEIMSMSVGHRLTNMMPLTHTWSFHSKLFIQTATPDNWDHSTVQAFVEEITRQALYIVAE
ncbi:uncharacterized protein B0H18DRAFT_1092755 [Fomitopsis serialis]|uniref:uncharacterized protein n=1 Tax=Fomitopsis serialis TaxID=139415 RepID=UPI0020087F4C|nr:uncharacterized protein B0H18DRAFT_1092755 [Neoantrodia serialis]KAH9934333.1 hypothetical protein B0H18DRAFT_1092755 [Neoantrodia serialis]